MKCGLLTLLSLTLLLLTGCRAPHRLVIERVVADTVVEHLSRIDTVMTSDSIIIRESMRGDTVWVERDHIHRGLKVKVVRDTIRQVRVDTIVSPAKVAELYAVDGDARSAGGGNALPIAIMVVAGVMIIISGLKKLLKNRNNG